ncbi:MAG: hypothetical protein NTZ25_01500 [Candidatus Peregrinibacteria bacterium]|nr:hypothetical protein [Candidatus Peregrinibacteria bacterium]
MSAQTQPGGNIENKQKGIVEKNESNLSETAQLVNGMMKEYIMPVLREKPTDENAKSLLEMANTIIKAKLQPNDPEVIKFSLACREKQSEINSRAEQAGCDEKKLAVVSNYFSKLITSVKSAGQSFDKETPKEMAA